jgi:predicted dehydrogenase
MTKSVNIGMIGMGAWGNHLLEVISEIPQVNVKYVCCRKREDVKINTQAKIIFDDQILLNDKDIGGVMILIQPDKHFRAAEPFLKKGIKVFIEKPLTLKSSECANLLKLGVPTSSKPGKNTGIMVGNKFIYSTAINALKNFISANNISIQSISSRWVKGGGIQPSGIFFDIAYHHIYLFDYFLNDYFVELHKCTLNRVDEVPISGVVLLKYKQVSCSIEVSYNHHYDFFDHSIRLETDKGVFIVSEKERKISVFLDPRKRSTLSFEFHEKEETSLKEELKTYSLWLLGEKEISFSLEHDARIIEYLENEKNNIP